MSGHFAVSQLLGLTVEDLSELCHVINQFLFIALLKLLLWQLSDEQVMMV
jgi:hypothetical protein